MNFSPKHVAIIVLGIALALIGAIAVLGSVVLLVVALAKLTISPRLAEGYLYLAFGFGLLGLFAASLRLLSTRVFDIKPFNVRVPVRGASSGESKPGWMTKPRKLSLMPLFWICLSGSATSSLVYKLLPTADELVEEKFAASMAGSRPYLSGMPALVYIFASGKSSVHDVINGLYRSGKSEFSGGGSYATLKARTAAKYQDADEVSIITSVDVVGFADAPGSVKINQRLSRDRAETVRTLLKEVGVPEKLISTRAAGVSEGACDQAKVDKHNPCLYRDRRVEVYFRGNYKKR